MLGTIVDVHVFDKTATDAVLGEHTFHNTDEEGMHAGFEVLVERFLHKYLGCCLALATGITCVVQVNLVGHFFAGENHFVGVDDDDVVAALYIGGVRGFVFAAQQFGNFCAKATENLVGGIDYYPVVLYFLSIREFGAIANGIHFLFCFLIIT